MNAKIAPQPIFGIGEPFTDNELQPGVWRDPETGDTFTLDDVIQDCNEELQLAGWRNVSGWIPVTVTVPQAFETLLAMPGYVLTVAEYSNGQAPDYYAILAEI